MCVEKRINKLRKEINANVKIYIKHVSKNWSGDLNLTYIRVIMHWYLYCKIEIYNPITLSMY